MEGTFKLLFSSKMKLKYVNFDIPIALEINFNSIVSFLFRKLWKKGSNFNTTIINQILKKMIWLRVK